MGFETYLQQKSIIRLVIIKQSLWDLKQFHIESISALAFIIKQSLWDLKLAL